MRSSTRAWRQSPESRVTWIPAAAKGGHRLKIQRSRPGRIASGQDQGARDYHTSRYGAPAWRVRRGLDQQQRGHAAAVAAHQFGVVQDAEGVDQGASRQSILEAAVALQHLQELF